MSEVTVKLQRDNPSQPWGFRIHGGVDFNQPLLILRVTAGSLASQSGGLQPGDQIISINGQDALRLRHREAQQLILNGGNQVTFQVVREPEGANLAERLLQNNPEALQRIPSLKRKTVQSSSSTTSSALATVIQTTSTVSVAPVTNTEWKPKFSEEGIKETIMSQAQVLACGAIGVNFMKNQEKNLDMEKSEVLKMLNEMEQERKTRAKSPAAPHQMVSQSPSAFGLINRAYEAAVQAQQPSAPWVNQQQLSPAASAPVQ